jgi:hypothetical protein
LTAGYVFALVNAFAATASVIVVDQLDHVEWAVVEFYFVPAAIMVGFQGFTVSNKTD